MDVRATLLQQLIADESFRGTPYKDSRGLWTVGHGFLLQDDPLCDLLVAAFTKHPLDEEMSRNWLGYEVDQRLAALRRAWSAFDVMPEVVQVVLGNMAYNMGLPRLMGFHGMLIELVNKNYLQAAAELRDSDYWRAKDTHTRAERLASVLASV